jgi:adenylate kinase family enzyme
MAEIIVVHGNPGSGKSTQCDLLIESGWSNQAVIHLSAGNRLRDIRTGRTDSRFSSVINDPNAPSPLPDQTVNDAIFELLPGQLNKQQQVLALIDGYPRHAGAVDVFLREVEIGHHTLLGVVALKVSLEVSIERILSRGKREGERVEADSLREYATQRFEQDKETTEQALIKLGHFTFVTTIDASDTKDNVSDRFKSAVSDLVDSSLYI